MHLRGLTRFLCVTDGNSIIQPFVVSQNLNSCFIRGSQSCSMFAHLPMGRGGNLAVFLSGISLLHRFRLDASLAKLTGLCSTGQGQFDTLLMNWEEVSPVMMTARIGVGHFCCTVFKNWIPLSPLPSA